MNAGLIPSSEYENSDPSNRDLYALILLKEDLDQETDDLMAASEINKLVDKYFTVSKLKPLLVYCTHEHPQEEIPN